MMKNALLTMAVAAACFSYGAQADEKTGGDIVVTYQNDVATLDPAIGYDWQNWSMIKSLFDGLMDYRPGTTELVNDLAESYAISEDGKVYTVPCDPYCWLSAPPSMNMILGVWWLGNLIYPEIYDYDMAEMTQEFYKTLWGYELSSDEVTALLANSTLKAAQ